MTKETIEAMSRSLWRQEHAREQVFIGFTENYFLDRADELHEWVKNRGMTSAELSESLKALFVLGKVTGKRKMQDELKTMLGINP